ncbi:unnamed protein product [Caenorhabditis angaria]|uniref:Uncharacterized protein n=1 Tax=Caenorhabditis angaria TaxID=860376 RepID=A0A9P1J1Z2_9PELO|nr:unnamed protein product [Caenorhabditis angaria]
MLKNLTALVLLALCFEAECRRFLCPFKNETDPHRPHHFKGNCERTDKFRKWLDENPEEKFHRSDEIVDPDDSDSYWYALEGAEYCCFEQICLTQCGINVHKIVKKKYGPLFPRYVSYVYERFPHFFRYANATEVKELEEGTASSQTIEKWTLYLGHLAYDWDRQVRRKQRFARSKC